MRKITHGAIFSELMTLSGSKGTMPAALILFAAISTVADLSQTGLKTLANVSKFTALPQSTMWCRVAWAHAGLIDPKKAWSRGWIRWLAWATKQYRIIPFSWHIVEVSTKDVWEVWPSTKSRRGFLTCWVCGINTSCIQV